MNAIRLRIEYLYSPIGIDVAYPRLMWNAEGGITQTAYQIVTESWDSGKVQSEAASQPGAGQLARSAVG